MNVRNTAILCYIEIPHIFADNSCNMMLHTFRTEVTIMLIRFCVKNFLSFKDDVEFSMLAGESDEHPDHVHKVRDVRILKTGVIFGPNASGKTNLIKAMSFAQNFIRTGSLPTEYHELTPFLLDSESAAKPSEFLFEIQCGMGQCFQYFFSVDSQRVNKESLYEILPDTEHMIFERKTTVDGKTDIEFGKIPVLVTNDDDPMDFLPESCDPRVLFLTQYKRLELELGEQRIPFLAHIYDWFDQTLFPVFPDSIPAQGIGLGLMKDDDLERRLTELIDVFDLGIDGFTLQKIDFNAESDLPEDFAKNIKEVVEQIPKDTDQRAIFGRYGNEQYLTVDAESKFAAYKLVTLHHRPNDDRPVPFDLRAESDGTRRLLALLPALFRLHSGQSDHVFVIDELDRSLHTHLTYNVLDQFLTSSIKGRSQLIVTTHDTGLLDFDLLRRDEIWFIEKDRKNSSTLFSLEEFKLPDNMNIEKGYLGGRFGAIPILSILHEVGTE